MLRILALESGWLDGTIDVERILNLFFAGDIKVGAFRIFGMSTVSPSTQ
jgi:hypothetical protein